MQQAKTHRGSRGWRGGVAESAAVPSSKSSEREGVSGLASGWVRGSCCVMVSASPSLLASVGGGFQLRQRCAVSTVVPSGSEARHSRSLQWTAAPPAELFR